jgi:TRAP-type mannitol/chloroaromatic compound transport system substrate-binding protein
VVVPGGNLLQAFGKGEIDAAELYTPAADQQQGLQAKVKLIYVPGWHQPETVLELIINTDRWSGLSDQQRTLIETACRETLHATATESARIQADALASLAAKDGVRVEAWPQDVLAALRSGWTEVAKAEGERDYFFKAVLVDIERFRAKPEGAPGAQVTPAP